MNTRTTAGRGDQTRDALLAAAMEVFGRDGFHAASTRAIAEQAGVNQALIGYHFKGKEGLYLAVFESIAAQMSAQMLPVAAELMAKLEGVDEATPTRHEISLACMETLLCALLDMLGQGVASGWTRLVIREQQDPTPAFEMLWDGMMSRMLALLTRLVGLATDSNPEDETTRLQAMTLVGQVLVFVVARTTTDRHMDWKGLGPEQLDAIREQLLLNLHARFREDTLS